MDILISISMVALLTLCGVNIYAWKNDGRKLTSTYFRSAGLMLICFTVLVVLLFGMRLFFKPDVEVVYTDTNIEVHSDLTITGTQQILDSKRLLVCDVVFKKSYPLMIYTGREDKVVRYKTPCTDLTADAKTEIGTIAGALKDDNHNAGK